MLLAVFVRLEPEEVARLTLKDRAKLAQGREAWLNLAFGYLMEVSPVDARLLGQCIAVRDTADVHEALDFGPEEMEGH